jgi:hypothetical protein
VLQFEPDQLDEADWVVIRDIEAFPLDPWGRAWPDGVTTLQRLAAWASWGFITSRYGFDE